MELKFINDEKGKPVEVILPYTEWKRLDKLDAAVNKKTKNAANEKFKKKIEKQLREGLKQVQLHQEGKIKLKSARQLLDEL